MLLSQKVFPFPLSNIRRYTGVPERSLGCARDDDTGIALSKHIRCTMREINPSPLTSFRAQREIFLALCSFLLLSQKVSPFPLSHIGRYTGVPERSRASLGMTLREYRSLTLPIYFPCNNDTREAPSTFAALPYFDAPHHTPEPDNLNPKPTTKKPQPKLELFLLSERLICQTVRAWCLLLLQYQ